MKSVKQAQANNFDLNLLRLVKYMMEFSSISLAARALGITQPAASNALKRLRDALGDEMFVHGPNGMVPTAFAREFAGYALPALTAIEHSLVNTATFDPSTWAHTMRIGVTDYAMATAMMDVMPKILKQAPNAQFYQQVLRDRNPHDELREGKLDLAIGAFTSQPANFYQKKILDESFCVIFRAKHPHINSKNLTINRYAAANHLLIAPWGSARGAVDEELERLGLSRRIAMTVPFFASAPDVISSSDLISTVPTSLAMLWKKTHSIVVTQPPIDLKPFQIHLLWHKRTHKSPQHEWLRGMF